MNKPIVRDWMSAKVVTVTPQVTLVDAYHLMKTKGIRRLPVVMNGGQLVGMLTLNDVRKVAPLGKINLLESNDMLAHTKVSWVMTREVVTITADALISEAARLLFEHQFGGLPVVDGEQLIGIITESDLFRVLMLETEEEVAA
jgi:acetoin utilization protein AcuB